MRIAPNCRQAMSRGNIYATVTVPRHVNLVSARAGNTPQRAGVRWPLHYHGTHSRGQPHTRGSSRVWPDDYNTYHRPDLRPLAQTDDSFDAKNAYTWFNNY
jgi:hypothetical protein